MHIRSNQQAYRELAESLETAERCWEIETAFPLPCFLDDVTLRFEPMTTSHEAFDHVEAVAREAREGRQETLVSSYAYTNGRAAISFGTVERARNAIALMVERGLITLEYTL
jgi:hypothetical protein